MLEKGTILDIKLHMCAVQSTDGAYCEVVLVTQALHFTLSTWLDSRCFRQKFELAGYLCCGVVFEVCYFYFGK